MKTCYIVLRQLLRRSPKIIYQSNQLAERWFNIKLFKKTNELVRSPFCLKKVPFRSPFLGNMGPLWVPFLKTSCPPQFLEHCWCLVLFLYTISAQPIRDELSAKLATATNKIILETPEKRKFHQQCGKTAVTHQVTPASAVISQVTLRTRV